MTVLKKYDMQWTLAAGSFVPAISAFTQQDPIQGVALSVLVGGIVLLVQFLSDVERSIEDLNATRRSAIQALTDSQAALGEEA